VELPLPQTPVAIIKSRTSTRSLSSRSSGRLLVRHRVLIGVKSAAVTALAEAPVLSRLAYNAGQPRSNNGRL
jgi:hypothetical protein